MQSRQEFIRSIQFLSHWKPNGLEPKAKLYVVWNASGDFLHTFPKWLLPSYRSIIITVVSEQALKKLAVH